MSKSVYVKFRGRGFWAFDVFSAVFLKHLIDLATLRLGETAEPWLAGAVAKWGVSAVISDRGFFLNDAWSAVQISIVKELASAACALLALRDGITAGEISSWPIVDDLHIFPRGLPSIDTAAVIRLGQALIALVDGSLPEPPDGAWWVFGPKDAPRTMRKRAH